MHLMNSRTAIRHRNGSCSLLEHIITDNGLRGEKLLCIRLYYQKWSSSTNAVLRYHADSKQKPLRKWIFDKRNYDPHKFRNSLNYVNWSLICESNDVEEMFSRFESLIAKVIRLHASIRKLFIRNNKLNFSLADMFVSNTTKCLNEKERPFTIIE